MDGKTIGRKTAKADVTKKKAHLTRNDLRITICLRKFEVSVERISVCYVIEN